MWSCLRQSCSRYLIVILGHSLSSCWSSLVAFRELISQRLVTNQMFRVEIFVVQQNTVYTHQNYEQSFFKKKSRLRNIYRSIRVVTICLQTAHNWNLLAQISQIFSWINTPSYFLILCKKSLRFSSKIEVRVLNIDSLKNNSTKFMVIFEDSCREIWT